MLVPNSYFKPENPLVTISVTQAASINTNAKKLVIIIDFIITQI